MIQLSIIWLKSFINFRYLPHIIFVALFCNILRNNVVIKMYSDTNHKFYYSFFFLLVRIMIVLETKTMKKIKIILKPWSRWHWQVFETIFNNFTAVTTNTYQNPTKILILQESSRSTLQQTLFYPKKKSLAYCNTYWFQM